MRQEEIIQVLAYIGIKTTRQTIARYEEQGLIPEADRVNRGQRGRVAEYPSDTVAQYAASYRLMTGQYGDEHLKALVGSNLSPVASPLAIARARFKVLNRLSGVEMNWVGKGKMSQFFLDFLTEAWLYEWKKAQDELKKSGSEIIGEIT